MKPLLDNIALIASVVLPLFNIPLVMNIIKRKSSKDISLVWAFGVWGCLLLMFPSGVMSEQMVWRAFNYANFSLFTVVLLFVLFYQKKG